MRRRLISVIIAAMLTAAMTLLCVIPAAALDDKYTFDEFGMSLKIPKTYSVITRDSEREDEVFSKLSLDYDETMTAFNAANIYLQAFPPDSAFKITLTVTSDDNSRSINNYSDLTPAQREDILSSFLSDPMCTRAAELKHGGNIFFDLSLESEVDSAKVYISQSNTVINGLNINLTMQKSDESILADESKALTSVSNTLDFDKITLNNTGPSFEWWRVVLWLCILAAISVAISYIYKQHNAATRRVLEQRRQQRAEQRMEKLAADAPANMQNVAEEEGASPSFEEVLGYDSDDEFMSRAATDLDSFDISVREHNPQKGVSYFEDEGDGIDDGSDYFDSYFTEQTPSRSSAQRAAGTVGAYLKIALTHLGYFFKNLGLMIAKIFKGNKTKS